jgi:hypothetical protein
MKQPVSIKQLEFELYCRDIAIRLSAFNLIDFNVDDNGEPLPYIWSGVTYLEDILEPNEHWTLVNWSDMPVIAELYNKFGEAGIYFWPAYIKQSNLTDLMPEIQTIYPQAIEFLLNYVNRPETMQVH